jgi:DNA-binding transcriptional ArsR family regulator
LGAARTRAARTRARKTHACPPGKPASKNSQKKFCATEKLRIFATKQLQKNMRRDIFQAIADPTRRIILGLLAIQAMTPNAIAEHFNTTRQAVSKHIQILAECEVINQRRTGREIYYHFNPVKMKEIDLWLEQFRKQWEERFDQLDKLLKDL